MLKNYTSMVPAWKSINYIEAKLVRHGAKNIIKNYDGNRQLESLYFTFTVNNNDIPFRLPSHIERCEKILRKSVKKPRAGTFDKIRDQAERTAWKILSDWVDIQISLIELEQAEFMEIFLPYVYSPQTDQTFYVKLKESNYKLLTNGL